MRPAAWKQLFALGVFNCARLFRHHLQRLFRAAIDDAGLGSAHLHSLRSPHKRSLDSRPVCVPIHFPVSSWRQVWELKKVRKVRVIRFQAEEGKQGNHHFCRRVERRRSSHHQRDVQAACAVPGNRTGNASYKPLANGKRNYSGKQRCVWSAFGTS